MGELARGPGQSFRWRLLVFLGMFAVLQLGWQSARGTPVEKFVIHTCTVQPAAAFINLLTPEVRAEAVRFSVRAAGGGLNILNGCDGLEAVFLLISAFAVVAAPWRIRLGGVALGLAVVFLINQARILVLFYAFRADTALFDSLHSLVAPLAVVLVVVGYFHAWLSYCQRRVRLPV